MFDLRQQSDWLTRFGRAIDGLLYAGECLLCGTDVTGSPLCADCRGELLDSLGSACPRCAMPLGPWARHDGGCFACRGRALGFDAAVALGVYNGPIRHLCLTLKRERNAWLAPWLAELMIEGRAELRDLPDTVWVVPVPLHWRRQWERGYNQAEALARSLARRLDRPFRRVLRRTVQTPILAGLGRVERAKVLHDAFRARPLPGLKERTVLLVDDVLTTGATCGAAARALKRAGAARVLVAVVARAEGNH